MSLSPFVIIAVLVSLVTSAIVAACVWIFYGKNQRRRPGCMVLPVILVVLACIVIVENGGVLWSHLLRPW